MKIAQEIVHVANADQSDLSGRLVGLVGDLAGPRETIEAAFLDVGSGLGEASMLLDKIIAAFATLPRDLESAEMEQAIVQLGNIANRTREISEAFVVEQQDIQRLAVTVDAASQPVVDLRRAVKMMGILAVNARIVAAGLSTGADEFDVFTTDIAELSRSAALAVTEFAQGHERLASAVRNAATQFSLFEASHRHILGELAAKLEQGLLDVVDRRATSATSSTETVRVSAEIASRVASAVMALQVGDATRQRVQHSEAAMTDLAGWIDGAVVAEITVPEKARSRLTCLVLELQEAQITQTIGAFTHDIVEAERALVELATDAGDAIVECRKLYGSGGAESQSSLAALGTETRKAAIMLRDCAAERGRLDALANIVGETVDRLLDHVNAVHEIEANMRLVGLNAAIKCAQLGPNGASLSVIAQQLRELTSELVPAARSSVERLEHATVVARRFSAASTGKLAHEVSQLEEEAIASITLLETVDHRMHQALKTLNRDGPAASALLNNVSRGLGGHASIAELLADVQMQVSELAAAATGDEPVDGGAIKAALQHLRRGYSMEDERRVHDAVVGNHQDSTVAESSVPQLATVQAAEELDDVLFF